MLKHKLLLLFVFYSALNFANTEVDSIEYFLKASDDTAKVNGLLLYTRKIEYNDPNRAKDVLTKALALSRKLHFTRGEIDAMIGLAITNNYISNTVTADSFLQAALPIAINAHDRGGEGNIYNNLGMSYYDKFDYEHSLSYYFKALNIFDELKKETKYTSTLNNIANLYYTLKEFDKALKYHQQSLAISRRLGEKSKIASSLYNIGLVYVDMDDPLKALACFQESLQLAKEIDHKVGQAMLYNSVGKCYKQLKDYPKALEYCNHGLDLKKELGDKSGIANLHNCIADIYIDMRNYDKAIEYSNMALEEAKEIKNWGTLQNVYQSLALAYSGQKKYELAYSNYRLYTQFKDSVFNNEKTKQLAEMGTRFETEKKDKELIKKDSELKFREAESKQKETQRNAFVIGFILVALLAIFVLKGLRDKQKANSKLKMAYDEIDEKNKIVEEKNKNITDSINYAKRIQSALLASDTLLQKNLPEYFIFYKPKDIVSGDFYWAQQTTDGQFLICTGDCTGHGVPGAFMSLLGVSSLNEIVLEKQAVAPNVILDKLRDKLVNVLNPEGTVQMSYDGMDCSLCKYDLAKMDLQFAAANNGLWIVSADEELKEYKADKQPVGFHSDPEPFRIQSVKLNKGDTIYTFTDGFADQFGGPKGKKFKYKQLQKLLLTNVKKPLAEQKELLASSLTQWQGSLEQIDDILVIGIRV